MMHLPRRLTLQSFAYALDGGTTSLTATDEAGKEHGILLIQHAFPQIGPSFDAIPGRLYFDHELVPMRSDIEAAVLTLLRDADVRFEDANNGAWNRTKLSPNALILGEDIRQVFTSPPADLLRTLAMRVIQFVESDEYVKFPDRVEQAADPTLYELWVEWDEASRKRVMVKLASVLGVGLANAKAFLAENRPLLTRVAALRVPEMVGRYHSDNLRIRVVPAFRWSLP
jgi:hypothetical protein